MVKAIPRHLLIHSAKLKTGKTEDEWSNPAWTSETAIQRVRFEPTEKLKLSADNREIRCSLVMFYDFTHSVPAALSFELGQAIEWNGVVYEIVGVDRLYDDERLHHLEVALL